MHRLPWNLDVVTAWRLVFSVCELLDGFAPPGLLLQVRWVVAIWQRHRHVCVSGLAWRATCKPSHSESRPKSAHGRKFCMIWFFLVALKLLSDCCLSDCCHCMHVVAKKLLNVQQCKLWNFEINSSKYPRWSSCIRRLGTSGSPPPVELDGHQNCSEPAPDRVRRAAPDVRDLASWSGPDEVNVTDNVTAMSSRCLK